MKTSDILMRIDETKALIRHVRTPEGVRKYGQPIGSVIVRDPIPSFTRRRKRRTASGRTNSTPDVSMVRNDTTGPQIATQALVAPNPDIPSVRDTDRASNFVLENGGTHRSTKVQLFKNDPPLRAALDFDYLNNASAKEAAQDLREMGVNLALSREFLLDREFMTALAETVRIHEETFPGFVYRHGNIYAGRRNLGGTKGVLAYNRIIKRDDSEDDLIQRVKPDKIPYTTTSGHDLTRHSSAGAAPTRSLNPASDMNQTATVFLGRLLDIGAQNISASHKSRANGDLGFHAINDSFVSIGSRSTPNQAAYVTTMTHEFGHAISSAVSGGLSFEIDGWEDPDQYKRRWYAEYYNNAMLDMFESLGVFKRTGKKYDTTSLTGQVDYYKNTHLKRKDVLVKVAEVVSALHDARDDGEDPYEVVDEIIDLYEVPPVVADYLRLNLYRSTHSGVRGLWMEHAGVVRKDGEDIDAPDDAFSVVMKNRPPQVRTLEDAMRFATTGGGTFTAWEREGYITDIDMSKWKNIISDYGESAVCEFEAETWASYMLDTEVTESAFRWGNLMHDMYSWWTQDDMDPSFGKNNPKE